MFAVRGIAAKGHEQKGPADERKTGPGDAQRGHGQGAVLTGGGVVVKTEQQNLVNRRTDPA